ncbi:Beta-glucuronidase [Chionoecetes opilio]|uniref:Beta-glucuronidase n=1 Tax=Chionoecetes opilio TaxID=41210 RepID=A0A8J5CNN6_CHIOP|nr:Beta-glucuronidase [Chionoecetes opilio]
MSEVTDRLHYGDSNRITVAINNTLTSATIPQGYVHYYDDPTRYPKGYFTQSLDFDFTNYAGIHRHVHLYTTPATYVHDVTINTDIMGDKGLIQYAITPGSADTGPHRSEDFQCSFKVYDPRGTYVGTANGCEGIIAASDEFLWWPYLMSDTPGQLFTVWVSVRDKQDKKGTWDHYPQKVGIRVMGWNATTLTINGVPLYLKGMGKHEDSDIRGKGLDYPLIVKDFSLLKWLGANSFRTSHYPYAEEIMDMADQEGIMVVDESPAVGLSGFGEALMAKHIGVMQELVRRDKNRPSVIMWSVGNEPKSQEAPAAEYFKSVLSRLHTRGFFPRGLEINEVQRGLHTLATRLNSRTSMNGRVHCQPARRQAV